MKYFDTALPGLNFSTRETIDPIFVLLCDFFNIELNQRLYVAYELFVVALGLCLLTRIGFNEKISKGVKGASVLVIGLLYIFGPDPLYLKFHWFPWLVFAVSFYLTKPTIISIFGLTLISLCWFITAGAFSLFGIVVSFIFVKLYLSENCQRPIEVNGRCVFSVVANIVLVVYFFILFWFFLSPYPMPDYSPLARVTDYNPFFFQSVPLIGPYLRPNPLVYDEFLNVGFSYLLRFSVVAIILLGIVMLNTKKEDKYLQKCFLILFFTFAVVGLEYLVKDSPLSNTPFQFLRRNFPGIELAQLPWFLLPFCLILVTAYISSYLSIVQTFSFVGCIVILQFITLALPFNSRLNAPLFSVPNYLLILKERNISPYPPVSESPSAAVVSAVGDWVLKPDAIKFREDTGFVRLVPGNDFDISLDATKNQNQLAFAVDNDRSTRWSTGSPQKGGETVQLTFSKEVFLREIRLFSGETDFPRGVEVQGSIDGRSFTKIISQPVWLGPVRWTKKGYPYFGAQSDVRLQFPSIFPVRYLRLIQLNKDNRFDWSIYEIEFYSEK